MIANYKVFEHRFRESIDIPIKMMQLFRLAKVLLLYSEQGKRLRKIAGLQEEASPKELLEF